jgi:hypothetical protein
MKRVVIAIVAALAAPAGAQAADYVGLTVNATKVAPGWTLAGTHTSSPFYRGDQIFGLTLRRTFLGGRGEEQHALRAHPKQPLISFDGRTGRWQTKGQLGSVVEIDMRITAAGEPVSIPFSFGCDGAFVRVPVLLEGLLTLRTGTRFFKTIKRTTLAGFVTYENGEVNCDRPAPTTCESSRSFQAGGDATGAVVVAPRQLVLQFRQAVESAAWYHVMWIGGFDALAETPPTIDVRAPSTAISGSAQFIGQDTTESTYGACHIKLTTGVARGSFTTTFAGWGARALRLTPSVPASYRVTN